MKKREHAMEKEPPVEWRFADATNRFSEVVTRALDEGPQRVRRNERTVVVLAGEEYDRLIGEKPGFVDFLMSAPSFEGVDLARDQSLMRDVEL